MNSEIKNSGTGKISIFISGREPMLDVDYPEALRALDEAYTQDVAELISSMELCAAAMDTNLQQLQSIRRNIDMILAGARARHLQETEL